MDSKSGESTEKEDVMNTERGDSELEWLGWGWQSETES